MPASAAQTIYKCVKEGQVTLTDIPCDGATLKESANAGSSQANATTIPSSSNPSTAGGWRGQMQYQGRENGQTLDAAHSVVAASVAFTIDGKVTGASPENGCKWLGIWSQGGRIISLDVSLTGCTYLGLNRRYSGTFILGTPDSSGQVLLQAYTPPALGPVRLYDIKGTLRR
jgi:Domain of unknown function (DUF4124)